MITEERVETEERAENEERVDTTEHQGGVGMGDDPGDAHNEILENSDDMTASHPSGYGLRKIAPVNYKNLHSGVQFTQLKHFQQQLHQGDGKKNEFPHHPSHINPEEGRTPSIDEENDKVREGSTDLFRTTAEFYSIR